jgi:hypothetical protein
MATAYTSGLLFGVILNLYQDAAPLRTAAPVNPVRPQLMRETFTFKSLSSSVYQKYS